MTVEELKNGSTFQTKIYKPDGDIEVSGSNGEEKIYDKLVTDIERIRKDKNKINYMSLAFNSLNNRSALNELKSMIKGIELTLD